MSEHARYREWIDRAFTGELAPKKHAELRAHLIACEECRAYHDRLGLVDRALSPNTNAVLPPFVRDRIEASVLAAPAPARAPLLRLLVPAFAGAAALAAVLFAVGLPQDRYNARGGAGRWDGYGVTFFCIHPEPTARVVATARAKAGAEPPVLRCGLDEELQIAYSAPKEAFLAVYGEAGAETFWYAPRQAEGALLPVRSGTLDEPLPNSTRLAVKHHPGKIVLNASFFDRSMTGGEAKAEGGALRAVLEIVQGEQR